MARKTTVKSAAPRKAPPSIDLYADGPHDVTRAEPIDLWDAWLFAEAEASLALRAWNDAPRQDRAWGHAAYRAALDREERAGTVLAESLRRRASRSRRSAA
ncbi:MAG: hypothetical protein QOF17_219 [Solirubrobacteraceae bacterium]|nr:hypothetical protein [Solirubrobacteraceae bacterium]